MEIRVSLKKRMLMGEFFSLQGSGGPPTAVLHFSRRQKTRENRLDYQAEKMKSDVKEQAPDLKILIHTDRGNCRILWLVFLFQSQEREPTPFLEVLQTWLQVRMESFKPFKDSSRYLEDYSNSNTLTLFDLTNEGKTKR